MSWQVALWLVRHRRTLWTVGSAAFLALLLPVTFILLALGATVQATQQQTDTSLAAFGLGCVTPAGASSIASLKLPGVPDSQQDEARSNATIIVRVAQAKGIGPAGQVVGLMTAMQETHLINRTDLDGLYAQLAAYYPVSVSHNPTLAAAAFFGPKGSQPGPAPQLGMLDIPNWQQLASTAPGRLAQAVQRSAFPTAYDKWQQTATDWVAAITGSTDGVCPSSPYSLAHLTRNGQQIDCVTNAILDAVAAVNGPLTVTQGSWSTSVEASGTTHAGAGASDWVPANGNWTAAVAAARAAGGIAWHRTPAQGFPDHIHMVVPESGLSASAAAQVTDFKSGGDGLGGRDNGPAVTPYRGEGCNAPPAGAGGAWTLPFQPGTYQVTAEFGSISSVRSGPHTGTDLAGPCGATEMAAAAGTIIHAGPGVAWAGNYVVIDHGAGITSWYAHMSAAAVTVGQTVQAGQPVGVEGSTGNSTGCHLHFEVRVNDIPQPTRPFMTARGVTL